LSLILKVLSAKLSDSLNGQDNKRLQRTGITVHLIDNLPLMQLSPGR